MMYIIIMRAGIIIIMNMVLRVLLNPPSSQTSLSLELRSFVDGLCWSGPHSLGDWSLEGILVCAHLAGWQLQTGFPFMQCLLIWTSPQAMYNFPFLSFILSWVKEKKYIQRNRLRSKRFHSLESGVEDDPSWTQYKHMTNAHRKTCKLYRLRWWPFLLTMPTNDSRIEALMAIAVVLSHMMMLAASGLLLVGLWMHWKMPGSTRDTRLEWCT